MNRATADNQSAQSEEEELEPTKAWVKDLVDEIIAEEFASPDLELHWLDEDDGDPETVLEGRVKLGALTLNEMRTHLGLDPYANPAADRPMVLTPTGYVPIEANSGRESNVQNAKMGVQKASPDDAEHPGWPAGTPERKGGQFRPKDGSDDGSPVQFAALENGTATDAPNEMAPPDREHLAAQNGSSTGAFWATRNQKIDQTSFTLLAILTQVVDEVGPRDALTPNQYGTKVHTQFADAVRAEGLPRVEVEQTFGLDPDDVYGAKDSIRNDVLLRDDADDIIAIWDVKTGNARLEP